MESLKEIFEAASQRIRSPISSYIFLTFLIVNWKPIYFLVFSGETAHSKFEFFDKNTNSISLYVLPLVIGIFGAAVAPYISNFGSWWATKPTNSRRIRETNAAHLILQAKNKFAAERENERSIYERSAIEQAKRDEEIASLKDSAVKADLEETITDFRSKISKDAKEVGQRWYADTNRKHINQAHFPNGFTVGSSFEDGEGGTIFGLARNIEDVHHAMFKQVPDEKIHVLEIDPNATERLIEVAKLGDIVVLAPSIVLAVRQMEQLAKKGIAVVSIPQD